MLVTIDDMEGYIRPDTERAPRQLTVDDFHRELTAEQFKILMEHATCLACLAGNSFDGLIGQYCFDAYVNLWQNNHLGEKYSLPNLFGIAVHDHYERLRAEEKL